MPDISIIVPIYNAEKYLNKCIDSLINQTKREIEIILINDGSTDDSEKIIKKYKDKRIKYFKNENQGIGKTRNFGIEKATGKYVMFVDSDDYIKKNTCEVLYKKCEKENLDLVICDFYKVFDNGKKEEERIGDFSNTTLKKNPNLLLDVNLAPWNKLYKRDLIVTNRIRFVEDLKYEDAPFVCTALDRASKIGKVNQSFNYYVIHGKSETTVRDERVFDIIKIVDKIRKYFKNKNYAQKSVDKLTIRILINYNIQQRYQINKKIAIKFIDNSFDYLRKNVPNYKNNSYFKERNMIKSIIEKSKTLTKFYCLIYRR